MSSLSIILENAFSTFLAVLLFIIGAAERVMPERSTTSMIAETIMRIFIFSILSVDESRAGRRLR